MPFTVYPDAAAAALLGKPAATPIALAPNEAMRSFVPLASHVGPDPTRGGVPTCYIRIAVSGAPVGPGTHPKIELLAHDPAHGSPAPSLDPEAADSVTTAVELYDGVNATSAALVYFMPPFQNNVYLLKAAVEIAGTQFWIRITNTGGVARSFVWVTADSDADAQQPWIHAAPATFGFEVTVAQSGGTPIHRTVGLANRGTGSTTVTDVRPAISAPYALSGLPLRLAPNSDSPSAVTIAFSPPAGAVDLPPGVFSFVTDKPDAGPFGATGHNNQLIISARTLLPNAWVTKASMPTQRGYLGLAAGADGKLYAVGGQGHTGDQGVTEVYDPMTDTWTSKAHLSTPRTTLALAATPDGKIYAVGGGGPPGCPTMEEYDPSTDTWTVKARMPTPRALLGAAVANGKIYAIGGTAPFSGSQAVEAYDPATNTWATMASMPTPRAALGVAVAANGRIYAVGGSIPGSIVATLEEYNPTTNSWATKRPMPTARFYVAFAAAGNGRLYAIGGETNDATNVATVEEYNPATDTWSTTKTSMSIPRFSLAAAGAANGKIYAIGGFLNLSTTTFDDINPLVFKTLEQYTP